MNEFAELLGPSGSPRAGDCQLLLPDGTGVHQAKRSLEVVFGGDDELARCRLVIGGTYIGVVDRGAFLDLLNTGEKGAHGAGDGAALPGTTLYDDVVRLRCPLPGCTAPATLMVAYDEDDPPRCSLHPGRALRLAS